MNRGAAVPIPMAVWAVLAAILAFAAGPRIAEGAAGSSSCVTCHTDVAKLQEEAKGIPIPSGSALQSGKG